MIIKGNGSFPHACLQTRNLSFFINSVFQVNRELKKLLVASVGDDLQYHFERLAREKNQLILENEALGRILAHTAEQLERMSIQCDVWRSKFLASRYEIDKVDGRLVSTVYIIG